MSAPTVPHQSLQDGLKGDIERRKTSRGCMCIISSQDVFVRTSLKGQRKPESFNSTRALSLQSISKP